MKNLISKVDTDLFGFVDSYLLYFDALTITAINKQSYQNF